MNINIFETLALLWFENENGDRQIPPLQIQNDPDALDKVDDDSGPGGFIFQHVLIHSVIGHDVLCKDPNTGELRQVSREYLPFSHKFVEGLVRAGEMDLRTAMFIAIEACEHCKAGLQHRYKFGIGYPFGCKAYRESPDRCRICHMPDPDSDEQPPEWFQAAKALIAEQAGE